MPAAESKSRNRVAAGWRLRIEAGQAQVTGPSRAAAMAARLAGPGTMATAVGTREKERDGEGERRARHRACRGERAVVDLLVPTDLVELHHPHGGGIAEVAHGRIDEGEVAVLADAENGQAGGMVLQQCRVARALGGEVARLPVEAVKRPHLHVIEEPIGQEAAEGSRVIGAHADVLVEMEGGHAWPGNRGVGAQRGEKLVLRRRRGEDDRRFAVSCHERAACGRRRRGRRPGPPRAGRDGSRRPAGHAPRIGGRWTAVPGRGGARRPSARSAARPPRARRSRDASASPIRTRPSRRIPPSAGG